MSVKTLDEPYFKKDYTAYDEKELQSADDISDDEFYRPKSKSFTRKLNIYLRNPETRFFAVLNSALLMLISFAFILVLFWSGILTYHIIIANNYKLENTNCLFDWLEWSNCSEPCRLFKDTVNPTKKRMVNMSSVVQAGAGYRPCPSDDDLRAFVDVAPCNTHLCPVPTDRLPFDDARCFYVTKQGENHICAKPRKGIDDNVVIQLTNITLFAPCYCTEELIQFGNKLSIIKPNSSNS